MSSGTAKFHPRVLKECRFVIRELPLVIFEKSCTTRGHRHWWQVRITSFQEERTPVTMDKHIWSKFGPVGEWILSRCLMSTLKGMCWLLAAVESLRAECFTGASSSVRGCNWASGAHAGRTACVLWKCAAIHDTLQYHYGRRATWIWPWRNSRMPGNHLKTLYLDWKKDMFSSWQWHFGRACIASSGCCSV